MGGFVTFGETPLRLSAPGHRRLSQTDTADLYPDGEESNVAVAASRLGVDATWISGLPDTPAGRNVAATVRRHGVETVVRQTDEGRVGITYHEAGAEPRQEGRWHDRRNTAAATLTPPDLPMETVQTADVVFSGLATPALSPDTAETTGAMLRAGSGAGATAAIDIDYEPHRHDADAIGRLFRQLLEHVQVVFVSEARAEPVLGVSGQARELANTIVAEYDLEIAVITRSQRGAVLMQDTPGTNVIHERDAIDGHTVDPSGTHEAFVGGFLARLGADAEPADALAYGLAAAGLVRTEPGPMLSATAEEIRAVAQQVADGG